MPELGPHRAHFGRRADEAANACVERHASEAERVFLGAVGDALRGEIGVIERCEDRDRENDEASARLAVRPLDGAA